MECGRISLHHTKRWKDLGRFIMASADLDQLSLDGISETLTMVFRDMAKDSSIEVDAKLVDTLEGGDTYVFTVTSDKLSMEYSIKFREYDKGTEFFFKRALLFTEAVWVKTSMEDIEVTKKEENWQLKKIG